MAAAFDQFKVYDLYTKGDTIGPVDVYMGKAASVDVKIDEDVKVGLYRGDRSKLSSRMSFKSTAAPITAGDHIADMTISIPGRDDRIIPLYAASDVNAKSAFGKAWTVLLKKIRG